MHPDIDIPLFPYSFFKLTHRLPIKLVPNPYIMGHQWQDKWCLLSSLSAQIGTINNFKEYTLLSVAIKMIMTIPSALLRVCFPYASTKTPMWECVVGGAMASVHVYEGCTNDRPLWSDMCKHPWKPDHIEFVCCGGDLLSFRSLYK